MQHEYMEAKLSIALAREKYPHLNPYTAAEKYDELGGQAHDQAIKELDGISGAEYDKWLGRITSMLKDRK